MLRLPTTGSRSNPRNHWPKSGDHRGHQNRGLATVIDRRMMSVEVVTTVGSLKLEQVLFYFPNSWDDDPS